jgi:4'-phosphopantetheinyl transferase
MEGEFQSSGPAEDLVAVFYTIVPSLSSDQITSLGHFLNREERARASRFIFAKDRHLFIAAHALLRFCLSAATGDPCLRFRVDLHGKPELDPPCGEPPLRFNLSHTNGLAACALSRGHDVGIDVEEVNRRVDFQLITEKFFAADEQQLVARSMPSERPEVFYRIWTLKEAIIKGIGSGLTLPLQDFAFTLDPLSLRIESNLKEDAASWQVKELIPTTCHRLALAAKRTPLTILPITSRPISITNLIDAGSVLVPLGARREDQ